MQGTGLPSRPLNSSNVNSDYLIVDENDMVDVWRSLVGARMTMSSKEYDCGTLIQTRERRRIVGDHVLTYLDQITERTYPDTIVYSASDYDTHGYPNDPYFALFPHDKQSLKANHPAPGGSCYTPFRSLLPKGLEGIIVTGLGISMERDASAMVRMQLDLQNQGYAAGVAGAIAARAGGNTRRINIRELQKHLVDIGSLPKTVLQHKDSFPLSKAAIEQAVKDITDKNRGKACKALARVLSHYKEAKPLLVQMFRNEPQSAIDIFTEAARKVIEQGAGILIAGLGALSLFLADKEIRSIDGVPVMNNLAGLIKMAELMVDLRKLGVSRSRNGLPSKEELVAARKIYGVEIPR